MPKLKPATQAARREHILDAAELCFAQAGFHGTTMQDICKRAEVSPGALYVYFASKEALIEGIAERDRAKLQQQFAAIATTPDLPSALARIGEHYTFEEPRHKTVLFVELGAEASRNPAIGRIFQSVDRFVLDSLTKLFERAIAEGRIAPLLDPATLARSLQVIGDGMFFRRAVDPKFEAQTVMPAINALVASLLNPQPSPPAATKPTDASSNPRSRARRSAPDRADQPTDNFRAQIRS
jgi:TetR/AcrR family transcriptional regulator, repressor for uid operon